MQRILAVAAYAVTGSVSFKTFAPGQDANQLELIMSSSKHQMPPVGPANATLQIGSEILSRKLYTVDREPIENVDTAWPHDEEMMAAYERILTANNRHRRAYVATSAISGASRQLATVDSVMRVVAPEGFEAVVDCPDGAAISQIYFAAYGLPYLVTNSSTGVKSLATGMIQALVRDQKCVCPRNRITGLTPTTCPVSQQTCTPLTRYEWYDAYYPTSRSIVESRCIGKERCAIEAETGVFLPSGSTLPNWDKDGSNPDYPNDANFPAPLKRLAIEAQCKRFCARTAPASPNAIVRTYLNDAYNRSKGAYATYECGPGFFYMGGANRTDCKFGESDFPTTGLIQCTKCGVGYYCPGDGRRYSCGNGTYSNRDSDTTPMCSGYCALGYVCPQPGSNSPYSVPCGSADVICPRVNPRSSWDCNSWSCNYERNWAQPTVRVPFNGTLYYSLPLEEPEDRRYYMLPCPPNRKCAKGKLLPHFKWTADSLCNSGDLVSGIVMTYMGENTTGVASQVPVRLSIETPGFNDSEKISWRVLDNIWDPSSRWYKRDFQSVYRGLRRWQRCPVGNLEMASLGRNGRDVTLRVRPGASGLLWDTCGRRFPVVVRGEYPYDPAVAVECLVHVDIKRTLKQPEVLNCEGLANVRKVEEGLPPGSTVGAPLFSGQVGLKGGVQPGVVMRYFLPDPKDQMDFAVDTCSGQIFTSDILNRTTTPDSPGQSDLRRLRVTVMADGASLGMGTSQVVCMAIVNVTRRNNPPSVYTSSLSIAELRPAGSFVGKVDFGDPDYDDQGKVTVSWAAGDARDPGAFYINRTTGEVYTTYVINALSSGIYNYYMTVNVSDGRAWVTTPLTIVIKPVPRPPVVLAQSISILEFTEDDSSPKASVALAYTHPLNDNVTWWLSPNRTFDIVPSSGVIYVTRDAVGSLDVYVQDSYSVTAFARDSKGNVASAAITINVVECNRAPVLLGGYNGSYNVSVPEYTAAGSATRLVLQAGDSNTKDVLRYRLLSARPAQAATLFSLDAISGLLRLAGTQPGSTPGALVYNESWPWPQPFTAMLSVEVRDNGQPSKAARADIVVNITEVRPRVRTAAWTVPLDTAEGTLLGAVPLWSPATVTGMSAISWSLDGTDARALASFGIDNTTGQLYLVNASALSYNDQRLYAMTAVATYTIPALPGAVPTRISSSDPVILAAVNATLSTQVITSSNRVTVNLTHVNRPPVWTASPPRLYTPYRRSGAVGPALWGFVRDMDSAVVDITEKLSFTIQAGNTVDSAYAINATNGQLTVVKPMSSALTYVQGQAAPTVTMTIRVCDAGIDGPSRCADTSVTVEVLEGNLPPVVNGTTVRVAENSKVGTAVGAPVVASDPDPGTKLTYAIIWSTVDGVFRIHPTSGQIFVNATGLNYEARARYLLVVQVTDSGSIPLTASAEVNVLVTDVNEAPAISASGPFFVPENSPSRTVVGRVAALDVDAGDSSRLTYSITDNSNGYDVNSQLYYAYSFYPGYFLLVNGVSYTDARAPFAINSTSGEVWVSGGGLDMETRSVYNVTVRVTDKGGLYDERVVTISLTNVNDQPQADDEYIYVQENSWGNIGRVSVQDDDAKQKHAFTFGPHAFTHYCTAWHNRKYYDRYWWAMSQATIPTYQWGFSNPVPIELSRLAASAPLVIDFRTGGPGRSKISVSASQWAGSGMQEWEDRYEVEIDGGEGSVTVRRFVASPVSVSYVWGNITYTYTSWRSVMYVLGSLVHTSFASNPDESLGNYYLSFEGAGLKSIKVGTRSSNELTATYTPLLTVTDNNSALPAAVNKGELYLTLDGTTGSRRLSSVCWKESAFAGNDYRINLDYSDGTISQYWLDFEGKRYYGVEVTATDLPVGTAVSPQYLQAYSVIEVQATDVNEQPYWNFSSMVPCDNATVPWVLACITIPENTAAGTVVATVPPAIDPDVWYMGGTLDYTFRLDNVPKSARAIDFGPTDAYRQEWVWGYSEYYGGFTFGYGHSSRDVVVGNPALLDFEATQGAPTEYRVWATDLGFTSSRLSTAPAFLVIRLTDVNEPPVLKPAVGAWRVEEMALAGTLVGTPADLGASDPDTPVTSFATLVYSIVGGDGVGQFDINNATGQISVSATAKLDYEDKATYSLTVHVRDGGGLAAVSTITVELLDVNEPPKLSVPASIDVLETDSELFGPPLSVSDPDIGAYHSWMVVGGTGAGLFTTSGCSGQLAILPGIVLDAESDVTSFDLVIRVMDNGSPSLSDEARIVINVIDDNEPPSIALGQRFVVQEAAAPGSVLGNISWSDPDVKPTANPAWHTPTFSLASEGNRNGYLEVEARTGTLRVGARRLLGIVDPADDADVTLTFNVDVTDGGGLRARAPVDVKVMGINYPPTWAVAVDSRVLSIDENTPRTPLLAGDHVGRPLAATDRNAKHVPRLTFALSGVQPASGAGFFDVQVSSEGVGQAQVVLTAAGAASLNFEVVPSYTMNLTVLDPQNATDVITVTVAVNDRNEAPTVVYPADGVVYVPENTTAGSTFGPAPTVTDPERDSLTYAIIGGNASNVLAVDKSTGRLQLQQGATLDFETAAFYQVVIEGTDSGKPDGSAAALSSSYTLSVGLVDSNEAPTWATVGLPTLTLPEGSTNGAVAGPVPVGIYATDVDADDVLTYSVDTAAWALDNAGVTLPFAINASNGAVMVRTGTSGTALDYEGKPTYRLTVIAQDKGGLSASASFTVQLTNVNEAPTWSASAITAGWSRVFARLETGTVVGRPLSSFATDPDSAVSTNNERLTFALVTVTAVQDTTPTRLAITGVDLTPFVTLDASTGQLALGNVTSFPPLQAQGTKVIMTVTVRVTDALGLYEDRSFDFTTTDSNHPPTCSAQSFSIDENSAAGTLVGEVLASDPDVDAVGQVLSYSISTTADQVLPFDITSVSSKGQLKVTTAGAAALDFEKLRSASIAAGQGEVPTYSLLITVTDGNLELPMSTTCAVTVAVKDKNEAPRLRPATVTGPATFAFTVPENVPAGTVLQLQTTGTVSFPAVLAAAATGPTPLGTGAGRSIHVMASDEDLADSTAGSLTFSMRPGVGPLAAPAGLFSIDAATGLITVSATATASLLSTLDFEKTTGPLLTFTVVVTDRAGLEDSALVRVAITDENDAPTWVGTGVQDANRTSVAAISVRESITPGSTLGYVLATDVDAGAAGVLRYTLASDAESGPFRVDAVTGALSLSTTFAFDWEDKALWRPTVQVLDTSDQPKSALLTVTVNILDERDAAVLTAFIAIGQPSALGVNVKGSAYATTHAASTVLHRTDGGTRIVFSGANLGLSASRLAAENRTNTGANPATVITARYGPTTGMEYSAGTCDITVSGSQFECKTVPSAGGSFLWTFTVSHRVPGGTTSNITSGAIMTGTLPPSISTVTLVSAADVPTAQYQLATTGSPYIRVSGANMGPNGTYVKVTYGPKTGKEYTARSCVVRSAHSTVLCSAVAGVGKALIFTVQVTTSLSQTSNLKTTSLYYSVPVVRGVSAPQLSTAGGETITIVGSNFGPRGSGPVIVLYADRAVWALNSTVQAHPAIAPLIYNTTACSVVNDTAVTCTSAAGIGAGLIPRVTIAEQSSSTITTGLPTLSYKAPIITGINGAGLDRLPTSGNTLFRVIGDNFGPVFNTSADRVAAITAYLGTSFVPLPSVQYGHLYIQPTAPVKPMAVQPVAGQACDMLGSRCTSQCGSSIVTCDDEVFSITQAGPGQVCFEAEDDLTGTITAVFVNTTDDRCEARAGPLRYTAMSCRVSVPHTGIECTTAPGVGKWHSVKVASVGGQASADVFRGASISFAPPVITEFSGEGSRLASTSGSQLVTIKGVNFGASQDDIRAVSYGFDSREFPAQACNLTVPHQELVCYTSAGAGARLAWTITVDNQDSVTPLTDYAPPIIEGVSGDGAVDAPTRGGSVVVLTGRNFATSQYLDFVTYGPTGSEYTAKGCVVSAADRNITCFTVPGTGRRLLWRVSVRGQASRLSTVTTSYAVPIATELSVTQGETSGVPGVMLYGTDLGVSVPGSSVTLLFDRYGLAPSSINNMADEWTAWLFAMWSGDVVAADALKTANISAWLATATQVPISGLVQLPDYIEGILFDIPDGCGYARELLVIVDGVPSSIVTFNYLSSVITNVAPVRDASGNLRIVVEGSNFCGKPSIMLPVGPTTTPSEVVVLSSKPGNNGRGSGFASVVLPDTANEAAQEQVSADEQELTAALEAEVYMDGSAGLALDGRRRVLQSTGGSAPASSGSSGNAGSSNTAILVNGKAVPPSVVTTRRVETTIPEPPNLSSNPTTIAVTGAAGDTPSRSFSDPAPFLDSSAAYTYEGGAGRRLQSSSGPAVASDLIDMDTAGGQRVYFPNVTSLKTDRPSDVVLLIGGRNCTGIQLSNPTNGASLDSIIWTVGCLTPPGVGFNMTITVCSNASTGGCSPGFDNRRFSYAAPAVADVRDEAVPASVLVGASGTTGIPTAGRRVAITGRGFGDVSRLGALYTAKVTLTLADTVDSQGRVIPATSLDVPVVSQSDVKIVVDVPEGYGATASLLVQTQGPQQGQPGYAIGERYVQDAPVVNVRYAAPVVSRVVSSHKKTEGGAVVTITGTGFGPATMAPRVLLGGRACPLLNYSHTTIYCTLPAGDGGSVTVSVSVAGQVSSASPLAVFTYDPPTFISVSPRNARSDGVAADNTPAVMTIVGTNFGLSPLVTIRPQPSSPLATVLDPVLVPASATTSVSHNVLIFRVPEGAGKDLVVSVTAGGQTNVRPTNNVDLFTYDTPVVTAVTRLGRSTDACHPRTEVLQRVRDGMFVNRTSRPDCYPTAGGFLLQLLGTSMGPASSPATVTIGDKPCPVVYHSHNETVCRVGPGMGDRLPVTVTVAGQSSALSSSSPAFRYDDPVITTVMPNVPFAVGGETLIISGYNFGSQATPVNISIGGKPCAPATWVNDSQVTCVSPAGVVGPKDVSILVANRTVPFVYAVSEEVVIYQCKTGYYGLVGEECVNCATEEPGAACPGGELYYDLAVALPGWYRMNVSLLGKDRAKLCHPKRQATREACPAFLPCDPPGACLGANECKVGYTGLRCGQCEDGYYKLQNSCRECPDRTSALVIAFCLAAVGMLSVLFVLAGKGLTWTMAAVALDYAQVLSLMNRFSIKWPAPIVTRWLVAASASFFNLELIAPECSIQSVTFVGKWAAVEMFPLLLAGLLALCYGLKKVVSMARGKARAGEHHVFIATGLAAYRILYIYMARNTLDAFNCAPLSAGDTKTEYLASNLDIKCNEPGGVHLQMAGAAIAGILVYIIGLPALMGWSLYRGRKFIWEDQLERAKGQPGAISDEALEKEGLEASEPAVAFRRTWHQLYAPYKPAAFYWDGVIAARKFVIIFTSLMFNRTTTFQQALALLVLFVTAVLHVRMRPYFTADTAARLLNKFDSKVQQKAAEEARQASFALRRSKAVLASPTHGGPTSPTGAGSDDTATALAEIMRRMHTRRQVYSLAAVRTRSALLQRRILLSYPALSVFLDANTVETVAQTSLILQGLAGVMFGSQLFSGANLERFFADQYDSLATATVLLMAATAAYLAISIAMDLLLKVDPDRLESLAQSLLWWNETNSDVTADKASLGMDDGDAVKRRSWVGHGVPVPTGPASPLSISTTVNPMLGAGPATPGSLSTRMAAVPVGEDEGIGRVVASPTNAAASAGDAATATAAAGITGMRGLLRGAHATLSTKNVLAFAPKQTR